MTEIDGVKIPLPPHDYEAERRCLAVILVDNSQWEKLGCSELKDDFFFHPTLRKIFSSIRSVILSGGNADLLEINLICRGQYDWYGDSFAKTLVWILESTRIGETPGPDDFKRLTFMRKQRSKYAEIFRDNAEKFSEFCEKEEK